MTAVETARPRAVADLAQRISADLVIIGPEVPLVAGSTVSGRRPEPPAWRGPRPHTKEVMAAAGVPTRWPLCARHRAGSRTLWICSGHRPSFLTTIGPAEQLDLGAICIGSGQQEHAVGLYRGGAIRLLGG
jgi:hypothetical protein